MVEFVSYDGAYPNLCTGQLVLKINGQVREFSRHCLQSGGTVWFDNDWNTHIENGRWSIDPPGRFRTAPKGNRGMYQ